MLNLASVVVGGKLVNNVVRTPQIWFYEEIWFYAGYSGAKTSNLRTIWIQFGRGHCSLLKIGSWWWFGWLEKQNQFKITVISPSTKCGHQEAAATIMHFLKFKSVIRFHGKFKIFFSEKSLAAYFSQNIITTIFGKLDAFQFNI